MTNGNPGFMYTATVPIHWVLCLTYGAAILRVDSQVTITQSQYCDMDTHVCRIHMYAVYTCMPYTHVCLIYMYAVYTCMPYTHICLMHMYALYTCMPYTHVCLIYMYALYPCMPYTHICLIYMCIHIQKYMHVLDETDDIAFEKHILNAMAFSKCLLCDRRRREIPCYQMNPFLLTYDPELHLSRGVSHVCPQCTCCGEKLVLIQCL